MTMVKESWISDRLCSFGEKVRIEKSPQLVELLCTDANLSDRITSPHYRIGGRDALGRVICPERVKLYRDFADDPGPPDLTLGKVSMGEKMVCLDWRAKFKPYVWRVYKWDGERFVPAGENVDLNKARSIAHSLLKEMKNALH